MIHLHKGRLTNSYFIERPWGNLLIYPLEELTLSDRERFVSKGGIYRQFVLEPFTPNDVTRKLFDTFGAAVVAPFDIPFDVFARYEKFGEDFADVNVDYLVHGDLRALLITMNDGQVLFTDSHFSLRNGLLISSDSNLKERAEEFLTAWKARGVTRVFTPKFVGKNYLDL